MSHCNQVLNVKYQVLYGTGFKYLLFTLYNLTFDSALSGSSIPNCKVKSFMERKSLTLYNKVSIRRVSSVKLFMEQGLEGRVHVDGIFCHPTLKVESHDRPVCQIFWQEWQFSLTYEIVDCDLEFRRVLFRSGGYNVIYNL
uniref:Uncharacterized protein n=1 Tax=Cacopsylla melanoneura TaxID=428564 RepID=A0A8D9ET47_9HEMI